MTKFLELTNFINKAMGYSFILIGIIGFFQVTKEFGIQMVVLGLFQFFTVFIYNWSKKVKEKYNNQKDKSL